MGTRAYNWGLGLSIAGGHGHGVSVNVGYFRTGGHWIRRRQPRPKFSDYTPFSIAAPLDSRLPGGGGQVIAASITLSQARSGRGRARAEFQDFADQTRTGRVLVDVNVVRGAAGLTVPGRTSTAENRGARLGALLPELGTGPTASQTAPSRPT